ncbi:hypothetical protein BY458DRAFT_508796 [Sporodiniella umbellata]|nr:hypothetical protein BY458DRAFT_508796 [Sporodiniella umbellata]
MWDKAAEAHSKAAEHFEIALNDADDIETTKTLKLLTANHRRKEGDLNRKIQRMKAAELQRNSHSYSHANNMTLMGSSGGLRNALPEKKNNQNGGHLVSRFFNKSEYLSSEDGLKRAGGIGESYAVLSNDDDNDDTFNKFLETVDLLLQGLINPAVAFTSTPLNKDDIPVQYNRINEDELEASTSASNNSMMESFYMVPTLQECKSLHMNPAPTIKKIDSLGDTVEHTTEFYLQDNEKLKVQITLLSKRLKALEHSAEEENTLKNSILQFRNNVHQQAKRIMQSHNEYSMRSSSIALPSTITNSVNVNSARHPALFSTGTNGTELVLANRLKDLEEENRKLNLHNEKQKTIVNKYKEKWDMLKENAKKRRALSQKSNFEDQE